MDMISERIKTSRKEAQITQQQLAGRCGISKSAISQYETGMVSEIESKIIYRMSKALNVRLEWLISGLGQRRQRSNNQISEDVAAYEESRTKNTGHIISDNWQNLPIQIRKGIWLIVTCSIKNSVERRSSKPNKYNKKERRFSAL